MPEQMSLIAALLVGLPFVLWCVWTYSEREVYNGRAGARVLPFTDKYANTLYVRLAVKDWGRFVVGVPRQRLVGSRIDDLLIVQVTLRKRFLAKPYVASVTWRQDARSPAVTDKGVRYNGLWAALYFLFAGFALIAYAPLVATLSLVVSGFIAGNVMQEHHVKLDGDKVNLGILVGVGLFCAAGTVICAVTGGGVMVFPGGIAAFGTGQCAGIVARSRWSVGQ